MHGTAKRKQSTQAQQYIRGNQVQSHRVKSSLSVLQVHSTPLLEPTVLNDRAHRCPHNYPSVEPTVLTYTYLLRPTVSTEVQLTEVDERNKRRPPCSRLRRPASSSFSRDVQCPRPPAPTTTISRTPPSPLDDIGPVMTDDFS